MIGRKYSKSQFDGFTKSIHMEGDLGPHPHVKHAFSNALKNELGAFTYVRCEPQT